MKPTRETRTCGALGALALIGGLIAAGYFILHGLVHLWRWLFFILLILLILSPSAPAAESAALPQRFFHAIHTVETGGRTGAILGDGGRALGPYQIHRAYWQDSRVPGDYGMVTNEAYARRVVTAYLTRYARAAVASNDFQTLARIHNGGPTGARKPATLAYWHRVQRQMGGRL